MVVDRWTWDIAINTWSLSEAALGTNETSCESVRSDFLSATTHLCTEKSFFSEFSKKTKGCLSRRDSPLFTQTSSWSSLSPSSTFFVTSEVKTITEKITSHRRLSLTSWAEVIIRLTSSPFIIILIFGAAIFFKVALIIGTCREA